MARPALCVESRNISNLIKGDADLASFKTNRPPAKAAANSSPMLRRPKLLRPIVICERISGKRQSKQQRADSVETSNVRLGRRAVRRQVTVRENNSQ
jgi:hypothetical protein